MGIVQAKIIGGMGNQFFCYASARKYAELTNSRFECPDWIGRRIFGLNDPFPSCTLPDRNDGNNGDDANAVKWGETDIRLGGYFQTQEWVKHLSRAQLKQWFTILPQWLDVATTRHFSYTACHLRKGDYIDNPQFCNVSKESYQKCIDEHDLKNVVWVDQANPLRLKPTQDARLYDLPDFIDLMRADVILRANSTFSWWAAVLSDASRVFSPVVGDLVGPNDVLFVEGNHSKFCDSSRVGIVVTDLHLPD